MLKSGLEFDDENIYQIPGAYQVKQDFRFNILYTDLSPLNYITEAKDAAGNPVPFPLTQQLTMSCRNSIVKSI
jgi:hypothetical protein